MKKRMLVVVPLICMLMVAMGGSASAPEAASTPTSMTAPTAPTVCAAAEPEWGGCRWYCGSKSYLTAAQCAANCSTECEVIC